MTLKSTLETKYDVNGFLGGKIVLKQPVKGYRAGLDAVLLATSLSARPGEQILEAGSGAGTALLCAAGRLPEALFTGLEKDEDMVCLARENSLLNNLSQRVHIHQGSVHEDPSSLLQSVFPAKYFDQSFLNPPFYADHEYKEDMHQKKKQAFGLGKTPLKTWIDFCLRSIKPKGRLTLIHRADRLDKIIATLSNHAGDIRVLPVHAYADKPAIRVLVGSRKAVHSPLTLLPPFILHDKESRQHTPQADAVLRGESSLPLWV